MPDLTASADHIQSHLDALCADIGNRLAASGAERQAAEYCRDYLASLGLTDALIEDFPFHHWSYGTCEVAVEVGGETRELEALPIANSRPTEGAIEAELVYVDNALPGDLARVDPRGKVLLIWGGHGGDSSKLEALNACGAAALIWVDERLPFDWPASVGTPYDWRDICRLPQVSISWADGWEIVAALDAGASARVRLSCDVRSEPARSYNALADLPGSGDEFVHIGGHLDTVVVGTGADDDASGVAVTLEVARLLTEAGVAPLRTVRFCCWGAEEQLSEGSRQYVIAHPAEVARTRLCMNLDAVGSIAGRNEARVVGPPELTAEVRELMNSDEVPYTANVLEEVSPYSDMFAFNAWGAPSVWLYRVNMGGMRHFHHSYLDDLAGVSARQIARAASLSARLVHDAATREPYHPRTIQPDLEKTIRKHAEVYYGW